MTEPERAHCSVAARWLAAEVGALSALGLGAAGALVAWALLRPQPPVWSWLVLALLPIERVLALRLSFDAGLFEDLGSGRLTLAGLDSALATLGLRRGPAESRPLAERIAGACALAWQHVAVVAAQVAILGLAWSRST